jgi:hypothetical protein
MGLVMLIGVGVGAMLAVGGLARRAALDNRMDCSFEALKGETRQNAHWDDAVRRRAAVQADSRKAVRLDLSPIMNTPESPAEIQPSSGRHFPLHARRAS